MVAEPRKTSCALSPLERDTHSFPLYGYRMSPSSEEVPLGSLLIKSRHSVRKRVQTPSTLSTTTPTSFLGGNRSINPRFIYDDYAKIQKEPTSIGQRIRNCVLIIVMLCFPFCIFMMNMLTHRVEFPPLVILLRTSEDRLSSLEPLMSILVQQPKVATIFVAIAGEDEHESSDTADLPAFLEDLISENEGQPTQSPDLPHVRLLYTNTKAEQTLSFILTFILQAEQRSVNKGRIADSVLDSTDHQETTIAGAEDTRILVINEESTWPTISSLVQGSLKEPDAVLSGVGATWRSNFRQVKVGVQSSSSAMDKFPNIVLHSTSVIAKSEDVLDSSTGIIFREGLLIPKLPTLSQNLNDLLVDVSSWSLDAMLLESETEDIVWSALLATVNVTRRIVPMGNNALNRAGNSTAHAYSSSHWMAAAFQLQQRWNVWQQYTFLDWSSLTTDQKNDIECEGLFDQECDAEICRPNPTHCSNYSSFWSLGKDYGDTSGQTTRRMGASR